MLEKLLAEIRSGGALETRALADKLGVTPEMLTAMLEHLQRAGYIQAYQACDDGCSGCSLKNACHSPQETKPMRLWQG